MTASYVDLSSSSLKKCLPSQSFNSVSVRMSTMKQYVNGKEESFDALKLSSSAPVPKPAKGEVQIRFHAVSLNYRDLIIANKQYPLPTQPDTVPASDGAGEITAVGEGVVDFKVGDKVSPNFNADHFGGRLNSHSIRTGLGGSIDGCLRQYGAYKAISCVRFPKGYSYEEAATLPCAALTAWNGLTGNADAPLKAGQWVLLEGTGGVSVFGAQIALASGCNVIITSSSDDKLSSLVTKITQDRPSERARLHTINYKKISQWGAEAKKITGGRGVDHILEVGGDKTFREALEAIILGGQIAVIGFIASEGQGLQGPELLGRILQGNARVRGILVGSVEQFNELVAFLETTGVKPVIDKVFEFDDAKKAYEYQWSQAHLGKVVVKV